VRGLNWVEVEIGVRVEGLGTRSDIHSHPTYNVEVVKNSKTKSSSRRLRSWFLLRFSLASISNLLNTLDEFDSYFKNYTDFWNGKIETKKCNYIFY